MVRLACLLFIDRFDRRMLACRGSESPPFACLSVPTVILLPVLWVFGPDGLGNFGAIGESPALEGLDADLENRPA